MISNNNITPLIVEALDELSAQGLEELRSTIERLFSELMKIEREQVLEASPYERTELRKGYMDPPRSVTQHQSNPILNRSSATYFNMEGL